MRITMKTLLASPRVVAQPGETIDLAREVAEGLIKRGYAVAADSDPAVTPPAAGSPARRRAAAKPKRKPKAEPELEPDGAGDD